MRNFYLLIPATILLFSVSHASGSKTKCANIVAESIQSDRPRTFVSQNGGGFEAVTSYDETQISSSKKPSEVKFIRKLNSNPEYAETYTLYKNNDRFNKGTRSRSCIDGVANKVCTYTVSLDESCNLDKNINDYKSLITYDRQVCLNVLKAYEDSKISFNDLGPTGSKPNKDLNSKVLKITRDREVALKTETGRDLHFPSYFSSLTLVRDCSMQINKENHYDGKVNVAKELTSGWFHEISKNIAGAVRR